MTTVLYNGAASKIHEAFQESKYSGAMIYTAFADACLTQHPLRTQKKASRFRGHVKMAAFFNGISLARHNDSRSFVRREHAARSDGRESDKRTNPSLPIGS